MGVSVWRASLAVTSACIGVAFLASWWTKRSKRKFDKQVRQFTEDNHGRTNGNDSGKERVLLIVNPAGGNGKAMKEFPCCMEAFQRRDALVEVYVTRGSADVASLTKIKDLGPYDCIAILAGDSTVFEFIQSALNRPENDEKWPYAPILNLPGGTDNVVATEFFRTSSASEIVERYETVRWGPLIKTSAPGVSTSQYAIHICADGVTGRMFEAMESSRGNGFYAAFGKAGAMLYLLSAVLSADVTSAQPVSFQVYNSSASIGGRDMGFGVWRLDNKLCLVNMDYANGRMEIFSFLFKIVSGSLAREWREGLLPKNVHVEVTDKFTMTRQKAFRLYADGSTLYPFEGESTVTFEAIKNAIPYYIF